MASTLQTLIEPTVLNGTPASLFTAQSATRIDQMTASNPSSSALFDLTVWWVPAGGSPIAGNEAQPARPLTPGEAFNVVALIGHILSTGDSIWASGSGPINFFASGTGVSS